MRVDHTTSYLHQLRLLSDLLSLLGLVGDQLLRPLNFHLFVVVSDVLGDLGLGNHQVENLYTVLPQSGDAGPHIGQNMLAYREEESVVNLVDGVVRTVNPATSCL